MSGAASRPSPDSRDSEASIRPFEARLRLAPQGEGEGNLSRDPCLTPGVTLSRKGWEKPPARETKFAEADLTEIEADGGFSGYASLFGEADLGRDMMMPGAFAKSIRTRGPSGVRMLFQHDPAAPIGVWREIREDSRGLFVRGRLTTDVARAREVLALMRAGAIDGLSIGFRTVRGRTDAKTGVRKLLEVDLWEISIVTFPMLPTARVSGVKAIGEGGLVASLRRAARAMRAGGAT